MRINYLHAADVYRLNHACRVVNDSFDATCYLVGSALHTADYRDVDVRLVLTDDLFDRLFGVGDVWSLFCVTVGGYLTTQTGLPVDFQVQSAAESDRHTGPRQPLGVYLSYGGGAA